MGSCVQGTGTDRECTKGNHRGIGIKMTGSTKCKTVKGLMDRLDNIIFEKGTILILKCKYCENTIMVSNWYVGESFKKLLEMNEYCEDCNGRFV